MCRLVNSWPVFTELWCTDGPLSQSRKFQNTTLLNHDSSTLFPSTAHAILTISPKFTLHLLWVIWTFLQQMQTMSSWIESCAIIKQSVKFSQRNVKVTVVIVPIFICRNSHLSDFVTTIIILVTPVLSNNIRPQPLVVCILFIALSFLVALHDPLSIYIEWHTEMYPCA